MSGKGTSPRREIEEIYPLTPMQEGMLFHALLAPGSEEYFEQLNVRIEGELDGVLLRRAFGEMTAAHGILRTGFNWEKRKEPFQIVYRAVEVPWVELDWCGGDAEGVDAGEGGAEGESVRERRVQEFLREDRRRGFDLGAAPVMRVTVIRFSDTTWQVTWSHHHLLLDGWSRSLLVQEWLERYRAWRSGGRAAAMAAPRAFRNYVAWLKRQDERAAEAFWKEELAGFEGMGALSLGRRFGAEDGTDRTDGADGTYERGGEVEVVLSGEETAALRGFAAGRQLTVSTVVQGAWLVLLGRLAGTNEPVCGVTVSGRPAELAGVEAMVGLFINTLPLRMAIDPARRVGEWLEALQKKTAGLRRFESTPLAKIQSWAGAGHDQPLFESIFVFENYPVDPAASDTSAAGFRLAGVSAFERTSYPLTMVVSPGQRMSVRLLFDGGRFDEAQARRLVGYYGEVLRGMIAGAGEGRLGELGILPAEEWALVVRRWNAEVSGGARGAGWARGEADRSESGPYLDQLCAEQARWTPEAVALVAGTERISYRELDARAEALAEELRARGVGAAGEETLVGICLERTPALVVAMLAVLKAGGAYVPLDPKYPRERVAYMLEDARARVVITQAGLRGILPEVEWVEWVLVKTEEDVKSEARRAAAEGALRRGQETPPYIDPERLAYVIYTSGSTGRPKGTAIEHRSAVAFVEWARTVFPAEALRGVLFSTSVCFDLSIFEVFVTLACGGTIVLAEDALALETLPAKDAVTLINTVPSAIAELLRLRAVPASVRTINLAGEPLTAALADRIYAETGVADVYDLYGPSEDTTYSTFTRRAPGGPATIGRPIAGTQLYLLDQYGHPVPVGVAGELFLGGAGLARGYFGRAELTAERFVPDPFGGGAGARLYRTGDLARFMADGRVEFLGRGDHQVKIRGFRIELGEIQTRLEKHPTIADVAVIARDEAATSGGAGGNRIVAYVVTAADAEATDEMWRAYLAKDLPHYMIPAAFVRLAALPRTPNGKVDRKALPEPESAGAGGAVERAAGRLTPTEEIVAGVWMDVLGGGTPRAEDDFFAVGGHSLLATQLVSRLREVFRLEVPLRVVFDVPTLGGLAAWIERALLARAGVEAAERAFPEGTEPAGAPLSHAQRRLWFFDQLQPGNPAYHIPAVFRAKGTLDLEALEQSVNEVVRRHAVLRTTFGVREGEPVLRVSEAAEVSVEVEDVTAVVAAEREARAQAQVRAETRRSFNLETGPLLRVRVVRLAEMEAWLVVTMHHIASDGWSVEVLMRELVAGLAAGGRSSKLQEPSSRETAREAETAKGPGDETDSRGEIACKQAPTLKAGSGALRHQYADFAVWQREWLQGERLERQVAFWREKLAGMPQVLELPADRGRPAVPSFLGASVAFELPEKTVRALRELGRQEGATPFMVLLAGFQILVARLSGQDDVAIGTPVANRHRAEVEPLIGFFVNTLVLRGRPEAALTFRRWVRRVRDQAIEAFTHQDLPFDLLVERLGVERDLARNPLFQVVFSAQPAAAARREVAGLTLEPMPLAPESVRFDLECHLEVDTSALRGQFVYATDLFEEARVRRMVEQFMTLLEAAGARPEGRLAELSLLRPEEAARVVEAWNATTTAYPREATVHGLFAEQAARTPDAVAATWGGESLTYAELERRANALARRLRGEGVRRGTAVALGFERSLAMVEAQLAVLKAGGFFVPVDPELPRERVAAMLSEVGAECVVAGKEWTGKFAGMGVRVVTVAVDGVGIDYTEVTKEAQRSRREDGEESAAMDLAYVMFTSGSTGGPKGVGVPHRAVVRLVKATNFARFGADEVMLQLAPYSFDAATLEFWGALLNGGRLAIFPPGTPSVAEIAAFVRRERVTTLWLTAGLFHAMAEHAPGAFGGVRQLLAGGDVLLPEDCRRVLAANPGLTLINGYGPTESTTFACCHAMTDAGGVGVTVPIGRPIANTRVYVLDTMLALCAVGVPGELFIGGDGLARGYVGQPGLTAEKFLPDPFSRERGARLYRTGDRVRWTEDGRIEFLGRTDFQVKIRGFRIELAEVEAAVARQRGVKDCAVVARTDGPGVKRLVAYVVGREAGALDREALVAALRRELPDYMVPMVIGELDALPLNANGKVDRKALVEGEAVRAGAEVGGESAGAGVKLENGYASEVEARIAGIWRDVLRVSAVRREENFFGLGGDSILSIQIVARARAAGLLLTPAQLFQHQTVAELARVAVPVDASAGSWAAVTGSVPLTPVQRWWLESGPVDAHHFNQAVLLEVASPMTREQVARVLAALDAHHDMLRGRLVRLPMNRKKAGYTEGTEVRGESAETTFDGRDGDAQGGDEGGWEIAIVAAGRAVPLRWVQLGGVAEAERVAAVESVCAEEQGRLEPENGVMWRAAYFDFGDARAGRLFVVVHHLVVDGVSWRILHEDLERAAAQVEWGEAIALPAKTTSFKAWSERLGVAAAQGAFAGERAFWREAVQAAGGGLPRDFAAGEEANVEGSAAVVTVGLDAAETERLVKDLPARRGGAVEAVLLACAVEAIGAWSGAGEVAVAMEGHGREEIFPEVDLSRTVGWFTAIYPLRVSRSVGVEGVAAQLKAVPRRGVGYGVLRYLVGEGGSGEPGLQEGTEPEVSFNYLGRFDTGAEGAGRFAAATEERGAFVSPRARRHHVLEINGNVARGELSVAWTFSRALHCEETIGRVAADFIARVRALLGEGENGGAKRAVNEVSERDEAIAEVEFN